MARWLLAEGFRDVSVLEGGLAAWRRAGLPTGTLTDEPARPGGGDVPSLPEGRASFMSSLVDRYLGEGGLPGRRRLATLFVDIAGSTRLLVHHSPEVVLATVQRFMRLVTEVALAYCGDVKDFEGDGALLYFESPREATQAAFAIRTALAREAGGPDGAITARMSLTVGDVILGVVGSTLRRAIALVGPSVNVGARLLKQVDPGGLIASGEVVEALRHEAPELAAAFRLLDPAHVVPGADGATVATFLAA